MKVTMKALKKHGYGFNVFRTGEYYEADHRHVRLLTILGKSEVSERPRAEPKPKRRGRPKKAAVTEQDHNQHQEQQVEDIWTGDHASQEEPEGLQEQTTE